MNKPEVWTFDELLNHRFGKAAVWVLPRLEARIKEIFSMPIIKADEQPDSNLDELLVIGGGVLIDKAKIWRNENNPEVKLIAIPSIWGSGAEASPIAVSNDGVKKTIYMGDDFLPDICVIWPEIARDIPEKLVKFACGDVWAHAIEGFLSPIASDELRSEIGALINNIQKLALNNDPNWFEASARACSGQAKSSVGLTHGIAHTLEGILRQNNQEKYFGHAALCSTYLWPVFNLNDQLTDKIDILFEQYNIDKILVINAIKTLFDEEIYIDTLPILNENWNSVLRDPCSRTNCALVRPPHISHFTEWKFK